MSGERSSMEIRETPPEGSELLRHKGSQDNWSRANMITAAHQSSADIDAASRTSTDTTDPRQKLNNELGKLEGTLKSQGDHRAAEAKLRKITRRPDPVTQLREATNRIVTNGHSILTILNKPNHPAASHLDEIGFLVDLANHAGYIYKAGKANARSRLIKGKMKKSNNKLDRISEKYINSALASFLKTDDILDRWAKSLKEEKVDGKQVEQPSQAKTLSVGLELVNMQVKITNDRLNQGRNSLAFCDIPKVPQSSEEQSSEQEKENAIRDASRRLNELGSELAKARRTAKSGGLKEVKKYTKLAKKYASLYEESIKKTERGETLYIPKQERKERFKKYIEQLTKGKQPSSQQATTDTTSMRRRMQGEFYYERFTAMLDADEKYTLRDSFNTMMTELRFVAPKQETRPVVGDSKIEILPMGLGTVIPKPDEKNNALFLKTVRGHLFHNRKGPSGVLHRIVQRGNKIGVLTIAYGYTYYPLHKLDTFLAHNYFWKKRDKALQEALLNNQEGSPPS